MADAIERVAWLYLLNARERPCQAPLRREQRAEEDRFQHYFCLFRAQFDDLLTCIGARISYQDTNYRRSISADERLSIQW
ncbi:hypothetical protein CRENBAI_000938 [Crenichthys baileyi]|uniref:Uncharacterized protein n=1 Tax=Crenichthys baileyi TaxID=28760 RepID=A0AAV9R5V9_9TELE